MAHLLNTLHDILRDPDISHLCAIVDPPVKDGAILVAVLHMPSEVAGAHYLRAAFSLDGATLVARVVTAYVSHPCYSANEVRRSSLFRDAMPIDINASILAGKLTLTTGANQRKGRKRQ